ncbi:hypothetical protein HN011_004170 [Eciton burchellii]|nr:hypothetical protein HN011_004170 [Eciton burchellii]
MAEPTEPSGLQMISHGANLFATNFVKSVSSENNMICSPLSLNIALNMVATGSAGNTEAEFKELLKLPSSKIDSLTGYQNLIETLNNVNNVTLKLANKIFIAENFEVKPEYKRDLQTHFYSDIELVNYSKSQETADIINNWCKEKTNNRIDGIVRANDLNPSTALILANAVYFKGKWANEFDPKLTMNRPFHIKDDVVTDVPTMFRKGSYKYADLPRYDAKCIELPYANRDISMIIILPNKINGLVTLTDQLEEVTAECNNQLSQTFPREVHLFLPKFKTETKLDLEETLGKMGLTAPFSNNANFSGISEVPLKISKVVQKAFIEVNEEGSEAAAVTGSEMVNYSLLLHQAPPKEFKVDHPFVYGIIHSESNDKFLVLFTGQINELRE